MFHEPCRGLGAAHEARGVFRLKRSEAPNYKSVLFSLVRVVQAHGEPRHWPFGAHNSIIALQVHLFPGFSENMVESLTCGSKMSGFCLGATICFHNIEFLNPF